ncbi:unnamed protein product [Brachionus calyciflorus]|uniref:Transmembrane protein 45B n=1 Tax=Brachionus calyciflorus TaxID=104777 RepID=A0A814JF83_9BILA|nr:unnamed protein product [Brachionus calyciflorus]
MGTLAGHLLPGSFFILFSIWWSFITAIRYVQSRLNFKNRNGFKSSVTMPCIFISCRNAPIESYLKGVLGFLALLAEAYTGVNISYKNLSELNSNMNSTGHTEHNHQHQHKRSEELIKVWSFERGNIQHITMYSAFVLGSIIEILIHYGVDLPKRIEYAMGILAFSIEAFLFAFHLHGKEVVDIYVHMFLVYAIFGCIIFTSLECYNPRNVLFVYGRVLFTLLQGTWFFQVGFMLYPPTDNPAYHWDLSSHGNIMIVTACFCWHIMLIVIGLLGQLWFVKKILINSKRFEGSLESLRMIDDYTQGGRVSQQYFNLKSKHGEKNHLINHNDSSGDEDIVIDLNKNERIVLK